MTSEENRWWSDLRGEELKANAFGVPPYDVEAVARFIMTYMDQGTVIDIGCGPGRLGHTLARLNYGSEFVGYDVSEEMVRQSNVFSPSNWTAHQIDWPSQITDEWITSAYSVTVFQHLPEEIVREYLYAVAERLVSGGQFVFTYATGSEDTFLSHQVSHETMTEWVRDAGLTPLRVATPEYHPAWNWMVAIK